MNNISHNLQVFIEESPWIFAKTYAKTWPHEYILRDQVDDALFMELAKLIRAHGYIGKFYQMDIIYFDYLDKIYWTMDEIVSETTLINRCKEDQSYEYRLQHNLLPD